MADAASLDRATILGIVRDQLAEILEKSPDEIPEDVAFTDLGADYCNRGDSRRQTRSRIRELERLNPGMKVTLTPVPQAA